MDHWEMLKHLHVTSLYFEEETNQWVMWFQLNNPWDVSVSHADPVEMIRLAYERYQAQDEDKTQGG